MTPAEEDLEESDFLEYLDELKRLRGRLRGPQKRWAEEVLTDRALQHAVAHNCAGGARTALAVIALRLWPESENIPGSVEVSLGALGVEVRW